MIRTLVLVCLVAALSACQASPKSSGSSGQATGSVAATASAMATVSLEPMPVHPGYGGEALPPGGTYQGGTIVHVVQKGQSTTALAKSYLKFTDYYTRPKLEAAIISHNKMKHDWVSPGQRLEIPKVRSQAPAPKTVGAPRTFEAKGIYITQTSAATERVFTLVSQMKPLGLNTVVFDVKDMDGKVAYPTKVAFAHRTGAAKDAIIKDVPKLVARLHDEGIHVVARIAVFHDPWTAQHAPQYALKSTSGNPWREKGRLVWVDPNNAEIQDYNVALAKELVGMGVDEIQFDYIRFPAMGDLKSIAYSFDRTVTPKHTIITGFLKKAYEALHPLGVLVSLDVFGIVAWDEGVDVKNTGQRMEDLSKYADVISPMVYPSHFYPPFDGSKYPAWEPYYFVSQGVARTAVKASGTGIVIRPWLQAFPFMVKNRFNADYITEQIRASRDAGAIGWLLWDAQNGYKVGFEGVGKWNRIGSTTPVASVSINSKD